MIGLLDCNSFYASCERVFRPDLLNKPVVVLSNNDGCVIARSDEVKNLGVPMGAPYFQVKSVLEKNHAAVFSSNFALYGDLSARVMSIIESLTPRTEIYSIDEAFIDFSGIRDILGLAQHVRHTVMQYVGIPSSIGIAQTKTLAKVANRLAKRDPKYGHICILQRQGDTDTALKGLKVGDIWGIGRQLSKRLESLGIHDAFQFKNTDPRYIRKLFTVREERLVQELKGISCLNIEEIQKPRQSIQVSRSFAKPVRDFEELRICVATYATYLGEKMRAQNLKTKHLLVYIRTSPFRKDLPQYNNKFVMTLPHPIDDTPNLIKAAAHGLKAIYRAGYAYKKAGIMALELIPAHQAQLDLFSHPPSEDESLGKLSKAIDYLNKTYGRGIVMSAACGTKLRWRDQKLHRSPSYTTKWKDIPKVLA